MMKNIMTGDWARKMNRARTKEGRKRPHVKSVGFQKGVPHTAEHIENLKKAWRRDPGRAERTQRIPKKNKLESRVERILDHFFPGEWKFVGDGEVWIGGRCPDFINVNGRKTIIEVFGDWWHKNRRKVRKTATEDWRRAHFAKYGFQTTIIWESEINGRSDVDVARMVFPGTGPG